MSCRDVQICEQRGGT